MKVTDQVTHQRVSVDEAYQRFFDGFYNLGRPGEVFQRNMVLSPPRRKQVEPLNERPSPDEPCEF